MKKVNILLLFTLSLIPVGYFLGKGETNQITLALFGISYILALITVIIKRKNMWFCRYDIVIFIVLLFMGISLLYSPYQSYGISKFAKFITSCLSILYMLRIAIDTKKDIELLYKFMLYVGFTMELVVLADFVAQNFPIGRYLYYSVHPIPLTMLGSVTALISITFYFHQRLNVLMFGFTFISSLVIVIIGASKGPTLAFVLTFCVMLGYFTKKLTPMKLILFLTGVIALFNVDIIQQNIDFMLKRFERVYTDQSSIERLVHYNEASTMFKEHFILGNGLGALNTAYPHNIFLELSAENGVLLCLVLAFFILFVVKNYLKFFRKHDLSFTLSISLLIMSLTSLMVSWTYVDHKYLYFSTGTLIICILSQEKSSQVKKQKSIQTKRAA